MRFRFFLFIISVFFLSIPVYAEDLLPIRSEDLSKIVLDARDTLVQKIQAIKAQDDKRSYYELLTNASTFISAAKQDSAQWSIWDSVMFRVASSVYFHVQTFNGQPSKVPVANNDKTSRQFHPLQTLASYLSRVTRSPQAILLKSLYFNFQTGSETAFNQTCNDAFPGFLNLGQNKSRLVQFVSRANPFQIARTIFFVCLLVILILSCRLGSLLYHFGSFAFILALFPHTFRVVTGIVLKGNPAVSLFHDPVIFALWFGLLLGLIIEMVQKDGIRLLIASAIGFSFLYIAGHFGDYNTITTITNVMRKYYWIATHIMGPALGYAGICMLVVAGCVVFIGSRHCTFRQRLHSATQSIEHVLTVSRVFTLTGIILGGIWSTRFIAGGTW